MWTIRRLDVAFGHGVWLFSIVAALLLAMLARGADVQVLTLNKRKHEGELHELTNDRLVVKVKGVGRGLNPKDIESIFFQPRGVDAKAKVWVELVDGSTISGMSFQSSQGKAQVELLFQANVEIPTRSIRWVRFHAEDPALAEQWAEILKGAAESDLLVVRKTSTRTIEQPGQEPRSVTETALDELDGTVVAVGPETAQFDFGGDVIDVKREKIEAIVYFHPVKRELPAAVCRVVDANAGVWNARSIELNDEKLNVVSTAGIAISLPLEHIWQIDFSSGNVKYLADLPQEASLGDASFQPRNMTATFKQLKAPRKDHPFGGDALTIGGQKLSRGLALSGRTKLAYPVPEGMRWFRADAGLDDLAGPAANLTLIILGDSREIDRQIFSAEDERKARPIELDLSGFSRLTIVVEDGQGLDIADQLDLANARFTK